jgi:AcrR family transcriptional regulator
MPKISATSIPEHREIQKQKIKVSALEILLAQGPAALNHGNVAKSVGLTRPAIYEYFPSSVNLLEEILVDAFEQSQEVIDSRVKSGDSAQKRLESYLDCILELAARGLHRPATAVSNWPMTATFQVLLKGWHERQIAPLISALIELGIKEPTSMILIGGLIESAVKAIESGMSPDPFREPILSLIASQTC